MSDSTLTDSLETPPRKRRGMKRLMAAMWLTGMLTVYWLWRSSNISVQEMPQALADWLERFGSVKGAVLLVFLYTLRPLIFFPSSLFTLTAGVLFGPWWGLGLTFLGEGGGAVLAFSLTRLLGRDRMAASSRPFFRKLDDRFQENGFSLVLILRLMSLPYDTVSYGCGLTSVRFRDFTFGTLIGSIPYLLTFTFLGGAASANLPTSINLLGFEAHQRTLVLAISAFSFLCGLTLAIILRIQNRALLTASPR